MSAGPNNDSTSETRVAWVVGGTRGIGAAITEELDRAGWSVVVSGRGKGALEQIGDRRFRLPVDVRDGDSVARATETIGARWGGLDATLVSIREQGEGSFESLSDEAWIAALDTKLVGFVRVARNVLPILETRSGTLVGLVGAAATIASVGHPLGCINAALRHVVRGLALEWGERGVRVIGVSPGPTRTRTLDLMIEEMARARGVAVDAIEEQIVRETYRRRMGHPEEVASLVHLLLDARFAALNGSVVAADDGSIGGAL